MSKILFLDCTDTEYTGDTLRSQPLGGIEGATVNLAEGLAALGHEVVVSNNCSSSKNIRGVNWLPRQISLDGDFDLVIASNDARLLDQASFSLKKGAIPVLWFHNRMVLKRLLKNGRWKSIFHYRPAAVFVGDAQSKQSSPLLPFRSREVIGHGIDDIFLNNTYYEEERELRAVFLSQPHRNLQQSIECWVNFINPELPKAEFHLYCPVNDVERIVNRGKEDLREVGVVIHGRVSKSELLQELNKARILIYPGHKDETFCIAAAEALSCGIAIVTQGVGALKERVDHGRTGFIAKNDKEMANYALKLFQDNELWRRLSLNASKERHSLAWKDVVLSWQNSFL